MNGIQALMPQGQPQQAPGQASPQGPMPGMQPRQAGPAPGINQQAPMLEKMNLDQLKQLYLQAMMPGSGVPVQPFAILSAISKKAEQEKAMQAVRNSTAMGQNAQQQGLGSIAQQVLQEADQLQAPVMAQGYSGGGAVAFQYAGYVPPREEGESFEDYRQRVMRFQEQKLAEEKAEARRRNEEYYAGELAARKGLARPSPFTGQARPVDTSTLFPFGPPESPMMDVPEIQIAPPPAALDKGQRSPPKAGPASAASSNKKLPVSTLTPAKADDQEFQNYLSSLRTRMGVPEDVAAGRAGLDKLMQEEMKSRQERMAQDRAAAEQRQREALERAPGVFSPEGLLAIAASIDPRRGYELGSAARGAYGVMAGQRKAQEEARKEFREFEKAERTEQNLLSQMRVLEMQRQQAIREGDAAKANELTDKIFATRRDIEKFNVERAEKTRQLDIQQLAAEAAMTSANKPTEFQQREALYRRDPKAYEAMYGAKESAAVANLVRAVNSDPALKNLAEALKMGTPEAEARYDARYKVLVATYAPELLLGAGGGGASGGVRAAADKIISGGQ